MLWIKKVDLIRSLTKLARNTYYKYKRELKAEINGTLEGQKTVYDIPVKK